MRLNLALSALAGVLVSGWAMAAQADAPPPPAAPIFYCPTPPATPAKPARATPAAHRAAKGPGCPSVRHVVARRRHWRHEELKVAAVSPPDVSASQAFIYRYEEALGGLDARAAHEAWAHRAWAQEDHMPPPPALYPAPPPPPPQCPSCRPHRADGDKHFEGRDRWGQDWSMEQGHAPPGAPPPPPLPPAPPPPVAHAWVDHGPAIADDRYGYEARESERAGGWSYRQEDGRDRYEQWGEAPAPRGPCPPRPDRGCSAAPSADAAFAAGDRQWRDGSYGAVYNVAGRDAYGFLVWPGKTPDADPAH